jgi:glycosyltransferase involved in cell wall biosynthesis
MDNETQGKIVYLVVYRFFDFEGKEITFGGMQHYTKALVELLESEGFSCVILQKALFNFEVPFGKNSKVIGVKSSPRAWDDPIFNMRAHKKIPKDAPVIYISIQLALPCTRPRSVGIHHGIYWDGEYGRLKLYYIRHIMKKVISRVCHTISVDTNVINWCRSTWPWKNLWKKMTYIPNFVEPRLYDGEISPVFPQPGPGQQAILFPRRAEWRRGIQLFVEVAQMLRESGVDAIYYYAVGSGYKIAELQKEIEKRGLADVSFIKTLSYEQMHAAYKQADIVVIPTICGEGTSLSCVEAMYCSKPVVVTDVGGLANLVIPNYNGLMVSPDSTQLFEAIRVLCEDKELAQRLGAKGRDIAQAALTKSAWRKKIWTILKQKLCL